MTTESSQHNLEDTLGVLITLASQPGEEVEQPPSPEELVDFFANSRRFSKQRQDHILTYLDSNPEAYDRWIKQGKTANQPSSAPLVFLIVPYAIAACAVLLIAGVFLLWRGQEFQLNQAIDHAYQVSSLDEDPESFQRAMVSLTHLLESSEQPLSFSQTGQLSPMAQTFLLGLQHDWQTFDQQSVGSNHPADAQQEDYQLGRWYTLIWTVSQQNKVMPKDFWQEQLTILNHLQAYYSERSQDLNATEAKFVALQLERLQTILQSLSKSNPITNPYRQLEQVLTALRYSLIPAL